VPEEESHKERINRELIELLNELRVALPGVQVLFAFLLTVPFTRGFPRLSALDRDVYFAAFIATALATAFLIAPSSYHRLRWRARDKERMLIISNALTIAGLALLAIAVVCVVFVITDVLFGALSVGLATSLIALVFVGLWYGLPLFGATRARRAR
jgi:uncharacterized protein DUF6328